MSPPEFEPPIQNPEVFDILGVRKDGGIDAAIVAATPIDGSPETLRALTVKVRNYIVELNSESFRAQYPRVSGGAVRIVIYCHAPVDAAARGLIVALSKEAKDQGILLEAEDVVA